MVDNSNSTLGSRNTRAMSTRSLDSSLADTQPVRVKRTGAFQPSGKDVSFDDLGSTLADTQPVRVVRQTRPTAPPVDRRPASSLEITRPIRLSSRSGGLWRNAWQRLIRNPEAIFGMFIIVLFILIAIFADWIAPYPVREVHINAMNLPPFWVEHSKTGQSGDIQFLLGTDRMGRDLLSWSIYGTRTSMMLGIVSAPAVAILGMLLGLVSGYAGGWVDNLLMRITDVFYSFPTLMISILVVLMLRDTPVANFQHGMLLLFIAFLSVGWAGAARLVRASVLSVREAEYVEAARAIGMPVSRLVFRHILPNCLGPLIVWTTLMVPQLILIEAILGYLQINLGPAAYREGFFDASWGGMIRVGRSLIHVQPYTIMIPAVYLGLISIAFTFLGDALRDALDPKNYEGRIRGG